MTLFGCDNPLNIASTDYVDCVVTTVSGHLQEQITSKFPNKHSLYFNDALSQFLHRLNVNSNDIGANTNLTINVWAKPKDQGSLFPAFLGFNTLPAIPNGESFVFSMADDYASYNQAVYADFGSGSANTTVNNVFSYDAWHMFTVELSTTQFKFYVDGQLVSNQTNDASESLLKNSIVGELHIAKQDLYLGFIRHLSIHNTSLSSTVVAAMYNNGVSIDLRINKGNYDKAANLTHYWFLGDSDDLGPEGIKDRIGGLHLTASGSPIITLETPHRLV